MKINLFIISVVLTLGLFTACSRSKEINTITNEKVSTITKEQDIREIAFNQLTSKDKERISGTWKDSKLSKIILNESMGILSDKSYVGKEVYTVDFPTKDISDPHNMIVFLGMDNSKLIGYGYVD